MGQMSAGAEHKSSAESGFGGWADEKIKTAREEAPNIETKKNRLTALHVISTGDLQ
jgi:hypothetical protein